MKHGSIVTLCLAVALLAHAAAAVTPAEIKLIAPLEETRGWCVDLFAHLKGAMPIGGFQTHNCFSGENNGAPTEDQAFDTELLRDQGRIRLIYFNVCLTMHERKAGSFVAAEPCNGEAAQHFEFKATGEIVPVGTPTLCLTSGAVTVPGGGGEPTHLIRKLSFEKCDAHAAVLQRWELRYKYKEAVPTLPRPYNN
jgi:hypothetical protein